jgi:inositol phosphorylceramide mannosyltransferase catalytic subunit
MIPKTIYQSWKTKNLSGEMQKAVDTIKMLNPSYQHLLYDDKDCRNFLLEHLGENYANAFDNLTSGAFKCDFWRYAVLYVNGGVYLDIDMIPKEPFDKILRKSDTFVSAEDRTIHDSVGIYQAFIAVVPRHPIMLTCLNLSFSNIAQRKTGFGDTLAITGPAVAGTAFNLFFNKQDTNSPVKAGDYGNGVRLFKFIGKGVVDNDGKMIISNKYQGYPSSQYTRIFYDYYHNDPHKKKRRFYICLIMGVIFLAVFGAILSFVLRRKWKKCEKQCSQGTDTNYSTE